MKYDGTPRRINHKGPKTTHAPSGQFSLCGAYFAPEEANDGAPAVVTCKRCLRTLSRLSGPAAAPRYQKKKKKNDPVAEK